MPVGVVVTTSPAASASGQPLGDLRSYFVAGLAERGDTAAPIIITSWQQAQDLLGARVSYGALYDDLQTYFAELNGAPGRAIVARVVGPAAVKALLSLVDASAVATLRIDAKDAGTWGNSITVQVTAGSQAGTFTIIVNYKGVEVERYRDIATPAAAVVQLANSGYVRAVDLGSVTAAPGNNPAVLAVTTLATGANDSASVTAAHEVTALARFTPDLGPGVVAIPGQPYSTVAAGLIAHAKANSRIALTAPAVGTVVASAATAARGLRATSGSEHAAFVYPWVQIPDGTGGLRTISPEGFVAGRRAAALNHSGAAGPTTAPAGEAGIAQFVTGLERSLTTDEINTLDLDAVTSVRLLGGVPRLYGWRSLSLDETNYRFLTTADLLDHLTYEGGRILERYVFKTIDGKGQLFAQLTNDFEGLLAPIAQAGGLYAHPNATPADNGYRIDTGPSVNTDASIGRGEVRAVVEIRDSPIAQFIQLTLVKVPTAANL